MTNAAIPSQSVPAVAPAKPSATVILIRQARPSIEVLMVRRLATASAFADVFVFPGGVVRPDDNEADPVPTAFTAEDALGALTERGGWPPASAIEARSFWRAAGRELFEEAGVLLARDAAGRPFRIANGEESIWTDYRDALQTGRLTLADVLGRERLALDYQSLAYFSHWITPYFAPRRFDTRFFLAEMPDGQTAVPCLVETTESRWISPGEALERWAAGTFPLVFPTRKHLERLSVYQTLDDVLVFARAKSIRTLDPGHDIVGGEKVTLAGEEIASW